MKNKSNIILHTQVCYLSLVPLMVLTPRTITNFLKVPTVLSTDERNLRNISTFHDDQSKISLDSPPRGVSYSDWKFRTMFETRSLVIRSNSMERNLTPILSEYSDKIHKEMKLSDQFVFQEFFVHSSLNMSINPRNVRPCRLHCQTCSSPHLSRVESETEIASRPQHRPHLLTLPRTLWLLWWERKLRPASHT